MSFRGSNVGITPPLHGTHSIEVPHDRSTLPPRVLEALEAALAAEAAYKSATSKKTSKQTRDEAGEALTAAWLHLEDVAASTSETSKQHHREAFAYAERRLQRALDEAQAAVQALGIHAMLYDTAATAPATIGLNRKTHSKAVAVLRCLQDELNSFSAVPPIDA